MQNKIVYFLGKVLGKTLNAEQKSSLLEIEAFLFALMVTGVIKLTGLAQILQEFDQLIKSL